MRRHKLTVLLLVLLSSLARGQEVIDIEATIEYLRNFEIDPNDTLDESRRASLNELLSLYAKKKDVMTEFAKSIEKDREYALKLKRKDKILRKEDDGVILIAYNLGKHKDFGILFGPFVVIGKFPNEIYIKCSTTDLVQLGDAFKAKAPIIFSCKFLGDFNFDNIKAYELIKYKLKNDQ